MVKKTSVSFLDSAENLPANSPVTPVHWHVNPVERMATRVQALLLHTEEEVAEEEVALDTLPILLPMLLLLLLPLSLPLASYHKQVGVAISTGQLN
jgi:hypothetical protein